jgi:hypothetical protein
VSVRRDRTTPYRRTTRLGRDLQFWVDTRRSDLVSRTDWEYGLLGGSFLRDYVLELEFAAHRVRFLDPERSQVPRRAAAADEAVLPLKLVANRPLLEITLGGHPIEVLLDTGEPNTAVLSGSVAREVGLQSAALPGMRLGSVRGPVTVEFAEARSLGLGPFELHQVPLMVAPRGAYNLSGANDSAIGYDVISEFLVRIDYPRSRLWLRLRTDAEPTYGGIGYAAQRRAGLLVWPTARGLAVAGVFPGSPAARLGVRPAGD